MTLVGFRARNHPQQQASDSVDDRTLPAADFAHLQNRFGFTLDAAASDRNHRLPRYFTRETDGLSRPWAGDRVYCNPPFSSIEPWVDKAWREHREGCPLIVMLLPANRTEQGWWQRGVEQQRRSGELRVEFLAGRQRFIHAGKSEVGPNERPPFGCCLLIWEKP